MEEGVGKKKMGQRKVKTTCGGKNIESECEGSKNNATQPRLLLKSIYAKPTTAYIFLTHLEEY